MPLWRRPWRVPAGGWIAATIALLAGVPLFLCMPPWNDVTLHDMVARTILRGGVIYRDVFDTNLPGIDWSMALIRWLFGWSYEVLRAFDLLVISGIVAVLCVWIRRCGADGLFGGVVRRASASLCSTRATSEFNHVQRDQWMMLPAAIAALLRVRRVASSPSPLAGEGSERSERVRGETSNPGRANPSPGGEAPPPSPARGEGKNLALPSFSGKGVGGVGSSPLEGFVWGLAVWVKPHVVVPAFAVWVVSAVLLARSEPRRRILVDFAGLILGGVLAGVPGVLWIIANGAWPYFLDIFLNWNPDYLSESGSVWGRYNTVFECFRPWSLLHYVAIPLAALDAVRSQGVVASLR